MESNSPVDSFTAQIRSNSGMVERFLAKRETFRLGAFTLVIALTMSLIPLIGWLAKAEHMTLGAVTLLSLLWLPVGGLGAWAIATYYKCMVELGERHVIVRGVLFQKAFPFSEITSVQWLPDRVSLRTNTHRGSISFSELRARDRQPAMQLLRERIPARVQHGWNAEVERFMTRALDTTESYNASFQRVAHMVLAVTAVACLLAGPYLWAIASWNGLQGWNAVLFVFDKALRGIAAVLLLLGAGWTFKWISQPE